MSKIPSLQPPAWLPHTRRAYTHFGQLWQVPIFLLGLSALAAVSAHAAIRQNELQSQMTAELTSVRQLLQSPGLDVQVLLPRLHALIDRTARYPRANGEAHLMMAQALLEQAAQLPAADGDALLESAKSHLKRAEALGVVPTNRPRLWYRMGMAVYSAGEDLKQAIDYLTRSLPKGATNPAEGYGVLVQAYLKLPKPDVEAALRANEQQLKSTSDVTILAPARLLRGELLVRQKQFREAFRVLRQIGPKAPADIRQKALVLQAQSCEAEGMWSEAVPLWEALLRTPDRVAGGRKRILYTLGRCYCQADPPNFARAQQVWTAAVQEGGLEGQAAAIRLAEMHLFGDQKDYVRAANQLHVALAEVTTSKDYANDLIPLKEVRIMTALGIEIARKDGAFAAAMSLVDLYGKLDAAEKAQKLRGETAEAWAEELEGKAAGEQGNSASMTMQAARSNWQHAATAYRRATRNAKGKTKTALLWRSAHCAGKAKDHATTRSVLKQLVESPLTANEQARAWYALAEAHHALGQKKDARQAWYKCLEYPAGPSVDKARYRLAVDRIEQKKPVEAEGIFKQILKVTGPKLNRDIREKSLYRLSRLLYEQQKYSEAYLFLQEAAQQFPANVNFHFAHDMLADSYRKLGDKAGQRINTKVNSLPQEKQAALRQQHGWLAKAAETYQKLADDLDRKPQRTALEDRMLRKASFAVADINFEMNQFTEALRRYKLMAETYRGQLEELFACQRIWLCCAALKFQPKELTLAVDAARTTVRSAVQNLPDIPENRFQGTWSRVKWHGFLKFVERQLPELSTRVFRLATPAIPDDDANSKAAKQPLPKDKKGTSNTKAPPKSTLPKSPAATPSANSTGNLPAPPSVTTPPDLPPPPAPTATLLPPAPPGTKNK